MNPQQEDLSLWKSFLWKAAQGISINSRLVFRWPPSIVQVDACLQGIGGYCINCGIAWRYQLPEDLAGQVTLNMLGFLAAFLGMVVEFRKGKAWFPVLDLLLSQGDSTSAAGWLAKSRFDDNCPLQFTIAKAFADFCLPHKINHITQWLRGARTRWQTYYLVGTLHLMMMRSLLLIRKHGSHFVPQNFMIIPLQPALISQIGGWLRLLPKTQLLPTQSAPSEAAAGAVTSDSSDGSESFSTLFSRNSDEKKTEIFACFIAALWD